MDNEIVFLGRIKTVNTKNGEIIKLSFGSRDLETLQEQMIDRSFTRWEIKKSKAGNFYMCMDNYESDFEPTKPQPFGDSVQIGTAKKMSFDWGTIIKVVFYESDLKIIQNTSNEKGWSNFEVLDNGMDMQIKLDTWKPINQKLNEQSNNEQDGDTDDLPF